MSRAAAGAWEVTVAAPTYFHGGHDLRPVTLEPAPGEPCRLVPVPAHWTRRVHVFYYGLGLRSLLAEPWDMIHCWEEPFILAGRQVAAWAGRSTPLVYATFQNLPKRYPPPFRWFERASLRRAAGWIAFGRTVADTLTGRPGYRDRPYRIIPPGVDVDRFRPDPGAGRAVRRELGWSDNGPPVVGFLGRFVPEKGLGPLTQVLDGLGTPWRALFVGAGPEAEHLRTWARRHGDAVRVCTDVGHEAVPRYLNAMDLLCAPSQTTPRWREQFGRMLIEAFACGVPVVGSDSGEVPHVIAGAGLVIGEADPGDWGRTLGELLDSPGRRAELARRGRERACTEFAWPVIARRHLAFFDDILQTRGPD
jgi:glycosyltransferase involved in cell wall biosynthesis